MRKILLLLLLSSSLFSCAQSGQYPQLSILAIHKVLDDFHEAAAKGRWNRYFGLMSEDAVFIGTDANERWTKPEFRQYSSGSRGWVYTPNQRNVNITPDGQSAWFDERLLSASYGTSRGTGVLILSEQGWKISQYHLTLPIPNAMVGDITDRIKAYENQQ